MAVGFVFHVLIAAIAVSILDQVGAIDSEESIVNGKVARPGQFPYIAYIYIEAHNSKYGGYCGGTLILEQYVLTAAWYVYNMSKAEVYLGVQNIKNFADPERKNYTSTVAILHEEYKHDGTLANNVALLKLTVRVELTERIQLASLPFSPNLFEGREVLAAGWGRTSTKIIGGTAELMYVQYQVITNAECNETFPNLILPSTLCAAGENKKSICYGDIGGPLILKSSTILIGIASFPGRSGCDDGLPQGFSRVNSYVDWINEKTGN